MLDKREKLLGMLTKMLPTMGLPPDVLELFQDEQAAPASNSAPGMPAGYGLVLYPQVRNKVTDQQFREIAEAILSDPAFAQLSMAWADAFFAMGERLRAAYEKRGGTQS